jgi:arylsulfatase A-like enzyme
VPCGWIGATFHDGVKESSTLVRIGSLVAGLAILAVPAVATLTQLRVLLTPGTETYVVFLLVLLTSTLLAGVSATHSLGRFAGALASLAATWILVRHWRDVYGVPAGRLTLIATLLVGAVLIYLYSRFIWPAMSPKTWWRVTAFGVGLSLAVLVVTYYSSQYLRWVVLQKIDSIGAPLETVLGPSPAKIYAEGQKPAAAFPVQNLPDLPAAGPDSPDVVFILVDNLRADALAAWGGDPDLMPELNHLAADSIVFTDVHADSSWTRPSVASFFTGLLPEEHGARDRDEALDPRFTTLAERFQSLGYHTAAFVSNYAAVGKSAGFDQGFETFDEVEGEPYARAEAVDAAVEKSLGASDPQGPLFLYVHYLDPHAPYLAGVEPAGHGIGAARPAYEAEVRYLDGQIAQLLAHLETLRGRPAWVFFTSSHGVELGDHDSAGYGHTLYNELIHVPAILWTSGVDPEKADFPLEARDFFDLLPRLAAKPLGVTQWARNHGRDVRYASLYYTEPRMAWRNHPVVASRRIDVGSESAIWYGWGDTYELYDERADPRERFNRAGSDAAETARLSTHLNTIIPPWTPHLAAESSGKTESQLRALGYIN